MTGVHLFTIFVVNKGALYMGKELTQRQKEIFEFIQDYIEMNGYPPSYREIGKRFEIASTFGVKRHIDALIKKGYLSSENNMNRTLSVIQPKEEVVKQPAEEKSFEIPIIGRVAAGYPILAEQNIEGTVAIDANMLKRHPDSFGLKVRGDSMIKAGIFEGDVVIVAPQKDARNGEIVVALLGDDATVKRFNKINNRIELIPENDQYSTIEVNNREDFSIIGKVLGVFRWYN